MSMYVGVFAHKYSGPHIGQKRPLDLRQLSSSTDELPDMGAGNQTPVFMIRRKHS